MKNMKVIFTPRNNSMEIAINGKRVTIPTKYRASCPVMDRRDSAIKLSALSNQEKKAIEDEMNNLGISLD